MFKLVVVGGKNRGQEFILKPGENILGREASCDVHFPVEGVSKKHVSITALEDGVIVSDLGSANGTFLNGRIVKKANAKSGDKIGLPNSVLQIVYVQEKKIVVKKKIVAQKERDESLEDFLSGGTPPDNIVGKIFWAFKFKVMPLVHGVNQEYEWRILLAVFTALFALTTITLTIGPVLQDSKNVLMNEIRIRGTHYADEISRTNSKALEQKALERVDTSFLDGAGQDGVEAYELFDLDGRVLRPISRLNEYTNDPVSNQIKEWFSRPKNRNIKEARILPLEGGKIGIGKQIFVYDPKTGTQEPVGIIAIQFAPTTLTAEASKSTRLYLESLITSLLVGILFFGIVYYLTLRPIEELKFQIEEGLRGRRRSVDSKLQFEELNGVRNAINTSFQRIRELQKDETDIDPNDIESDDTYVNTLKEFLRGAAGPVVILNSEKNLIEINTAAEDLCGIRKSMSEGMNILDITKERGFAATLIELCDNSANNGGTSQSSNYELQGKQYVVHSNCLIGKDGFAKAFYISFVLDT
jgi:hypothetical protein